MWPIAEVARLAGTTSRTLRHYHQIGLLVPAAIGENGYRYYDTGALVRLQRILLLRDLGLSLPDIRAILDQQLDQVSALQKHLRWLEQERERIGKQIVSLEHTIEALNERNTPMPERMFEGFDHTQYRDEVIERWGEDAWNSSTASWNAMSAQEKQAMMEEQVAIATAFAEAHRAGLEPASEEVQNIVDRHVRWLSLTTRPNATYVRNLADLYVNDPRFGENYDSHAPGSAQFVHDAMYVWADVHADD